ncbi:MAG: methyltransferase domain-containing protein [Acidimicrobiales bacterium]
MNSDAPDAVDEADDRAYLERVRKEIDEEVRRRRAAGDFPPSFERKLDELFARFTPTGSADDHFTEALKLADRSAYFDIDVPFGSRRQPRGFVKWSLWQAEAWFVRYVVTQLNHFAASAMRVLHLLDERVGDLESDVALLTPPPLPEEDELAPGADPSPYLQVLTAKLSSSAGRVLHAECGSGALLSALGDAGADCYGVDPGTTASDRAAEAALDVRRDDVVGHLGSLGPEVLGGIVLSGIVDRAAMSERRRILRLAELALAPGGTLAVLGIAPEAWERTAGPIVADLAPGRPLHAETWAHLFQGMGLGGVEVHTGPDSYAVLGVKRSGAR